MSAIAGIYYTITIVIIVPALVSLHILKYLVVNLIHIKAQTLPLLHFHKQPRMFDDNDNVIYPNPPISIIYVGIIY